MEEILQYNYQRKAKFEFFRPELRVRLCFGFWEKNNITKISKLKLPCLLRFRTLIMAIKSKDDQRPTTWQLRLCLSYSWWIECWLSLPDIKNSVYGNHSETKECWYRPLHCCPLCCGCNQYQSYNQTGTYH